MTTTVAQWAGASVLSGAVGGAVGGFTSTTAAKMGQGASLGEALSAGAASAAREAVVGAVGGLVGGLAGRAVALSFSRSAFAMARCEGWRTHVSSAVADVVEGAADGGAGGGLDGFLQTGTLAGAWNGAVQGAATGGLMAGAGAGLSLAGAKWRGALACFSAGTPLLTPDGSKPIEAFGPGDLVLSRDENLLGGPIEPKVVEEIFVRMARIMQLVVRGVTIETTAEHPFWVLGKGRLPAGELSPGDFLTTHTGEWVRVDAVDPTEVWGQVYNLRVSDYHTYFVGCDEWGWSVWSHNADYSGHRMETPEAAAGIAA